MIKKQGFTLIELLAVIVVLAVIALIATPIILNVIEESGKGSAEQSANGYKEAIENQVMLNEVDSSKESIVDGVHSVDELKSLGVEVKGQEPENGNVYIENGIVKNYIFGIGDYVVENGVATKSTNKKKYENGYAIYYNPVSGEICEDYVEDNSKNENKVGCMKWYVFNDSEDASTINMILDHNTSAVIAWNTEGEHGTNISYKDSNIVPEVNKLITESNWKSVPRIITAYEINEITGKTDWKQNGTMYCLESKKLDLDKYPYCDNEGTYGWLYDYTMCKNKTYDWKCPNNDESNFGYWTSTIYTVKKDITNVWYLYRGGALDFNASTIDKGSGIRPVITISKSLIK